MNHTTFLLASIHFLGAALQQRPALQELEISAEKGISCSPMTLLCSVSVITEWQVSAESAPRFRERQHFFSPPLFPTPCHTYLIASGSALQTSLHLQSQQQQKKQVNCLPASGELHYSNPQACFVLPDIPGIARQQDQLSGLKNKAFK